MFVLGNKLGISNHVPIFYSFLYDLLVQRDEAVVSKGFKLKSQVELLGLVLEPDQFQSSAVEHEIISDCLHFYWLSV
jgi:hypothetical protein